MLRPILAALAVALALAAPAATSALPPEHAVHDANGRLATAQATYPWPVVPHAVPLCFRFTNVGDVTVYLPSDAPWRVLHEDGRPAENHIAFDVIVPLEPGESRRDCWQHDPFWAGLVTPPGNYVVEWTYFVEEPTFEFRDLRLPVTLAPPA